jgi:hypothetical protein
MRRACTALCLALTSALAHGQVTDQGVDRLTDGTLAERDAAWAELASAGAATPMDDVIDQLRRNDLTPEQRARLRQLGQRLFETRERAALGVSFDTRNRDDHVTIDRVIENFPVADFLRAGDIVRRVDGRPLRGTDHMRWMILSKEPGQTLTMLVDRAAREGAGGPMETLTLEVPLGRYADLETGRALSPLDLHVAFDVLLERSSASGDPAAGVPAISTGLNPVEWLEREGYWPEFSGELPEFPSANIDRPIGRDSSRVISLGGQPRLTGETEALRAADANHRQRLINRRLASREPLTEWEDALGLFRLNAHRLVEIAQRLQAGETASSRPRSLDGFRREQAQVSESFRGNIVEVQALTIRGTMTPPDPGNNDQP